MKINWKSMAVSFAVLIGISGVAFGQDRDDHRDRDNRTRVENHDRDHDRDNRGWNNGRVYVPDNRRVYSSWYGDRDHPVYNGRFYENHAYNPYYQQRYGR
jgi:hypothetical protein